MEIHANMQIFLHAYIYTHDYTHAYIHCYVQYDVGIHAIPTYSFYQWLHEVLTYHEWMNYCS